MNGFQKMIAFLGRVLFSLIFIFSGVSKIFNWDASEQLVVNEMLDLVSQAFQTGWAQFMVDKVIPIAPTLLVVATIMEILGGLLILLGVQVRLGAFLLFILLIPTTLLFHHFWMMDGPTKEIQMVMFMKNVTILGGTLILLAFGRGDRKHKPAK